MTEGVTNLGFIRSECCVHCDLSLVSVSQHYLQLPWCLNGQAKWCFFLIWQRCCFVEIKVPKLMVMKNTVLVFFFPHTHAKGVSWMFFPQFCCTFLAHVIHIIGHVKMCREYMVFFQ